MNNYRAKLGRTLTAAHCGSDTDTSKRLAALSVRRRKGILRRFVQSLDDGRFEFAGTGLSAGTIS